MYIQKQQRKREMQHYLVSFGLMIIFTLLAFGTVMIDGIPKHFTSFFIVTLAIVQVLFQLYYFMHLKDKDHGFPTLFIFSGALVAFITVLTFVSIVWIS
nr:cytochrome C oxidase subunit IV family protein [Scopulibacillus darangshiensis]